jgi:TonB family protein
MTFYSGLRYPAKAREDNIQGKVIIAFIIDENGKVSNFSVKKGIGGGCDEEALKAIKNIDGDWLPALLNGKAVAVECQVPVSFTLSNG